MSKKTRRPSRTGLLAIVTTVAFFGLVGTLFALRASNPPETGPMGGLMYEGNMHASGVATAAGLQVDGAEVAMGHVPNDVTVVPEWTITNTTDHPVTLGEPHASVIEGCCPGPLELTVATLAPGESTQLTFPLQMHDGMDGPHDFDIHVPVLGTDEYLTLGVIGTFGST
jgi:hypothetical protein